MFCNYCVFRSTVSALCALLSCSAAICQMMSMWLSVWTNKWWWWWWSSSSFGTVYLRCFGSHWWRNIGKCGRLNQSNCLSVAHYNTVILTYNIRVMVIVWRLRGNIIRTAVCWIVWHNVHSQQHTYVSSSYRSNRLGLSYWDHYAVRRGGCL